MHDVASTRVSLRKYVPIDEQAPTNPVSYTEQTDASKKHSLLRLDSSDPQLVFRDSIQMGFQVTASVKNCPTTRTV